LNAPVAQLDRAPAF